MNSAKEKVLNILNDVPDTVEDEIDVMNNIYHNIRLNLSRQAIEDGDVYSTEDVRDYFSKKRQGVVS